MAQPYQGARFCWVKVNISRLSTKTCNPGATGSLRHLILKVFCAVLKSAPFSVNSSTLLSSHMMSPGGGTRLTWAACITSPSRSQRWTRGRLSGGRGYMWTVRAMWLSGTARGHRARRGRGPHTSTEVSVKVRGKLCFAQDFSRPAEATALSRYNVKR